MHGKTPSSGRWLRFSLRTLIVLVSLSAVAFAQFYYELERAESRRLAVQHLRDFPAMVQYEHGQRNPTASNQSGNGSEDSSVIRAWLTKQLGVDFFFNVRLVCLEGRNKFSDVDLAAVCHLHKLKSLRLGRTVVTDEGMGPISNLVELQRLSLSSPHLTDRAMSHVAKLGKLETLSLFDVPVTDAGLVQLTVLDDLEAVYLRNTQVTKDGVAALQSALPNCRVSLKP